MWSAKTIDAETEKIRSMNHTYDSDIVGAKANIYAGRIAMVESDTEAARTREKTRILDLSRSFLEDKQQLFALMVKPRYRQC
jgi:hypothetical protein